MALTSVNNQSGKVPMGQNGRVFVWGTFAFTTTAASGTLKLPVRQLESLVITPCGTPASDEVVSGPANTSGVVDASSGVTITRTGASKTSGLVCSYIGVGFEG